MMRNWLIHYLLRRPYRLYCGVDRGTGPTVVLLHGLGSSWETWRPLIDELEGEPIRLVALDLLGFGQSPQPTDSWVTYSAEEQARSVVATLRRLHVKGPALVAGHSMGCFVAVEVAALVPRSVSRLLLYEPPFYVGLPERSVYRLRLKAYFALFHAILKRRGEDFGRVQRLVGRSFGFELTPQNWIPFERSLRNAILQQRALDDLRRLDTPAQIIYGRLDRWVINDKKNLFFSDEGERVTAAQVTAQHHVSPRAARVLSRLIREDIMVG